MRHLLLYESYTNSNAENLLEFLKINNIIKYGYITGSPTRVIECTVYPDLFNKNTVDTIMQMGWYVANVNERRYRGELGLAGEYIIKPLYGTVVASPTKLYHASPTVNDESILKHGLLPKSGNKKDAHPPRIYLTKSPDLLNSFIKQLRYYQTGNYTIWQINMSLISEPVYLDEEVITGCYYVADLKIPPSLISKHSEI